MIVVNKRLDKAMIEVCGLQRPHHALLRFVL